jgi:8-oxo-dGTP pyrophosphatase MutT (NUDIX family)
LTERRANRRTEALVSAGGVVYRQVNGPIEVVLCGLVMPAAGGRAWAHRRTKNTGPPGERIRWSLAKGTPDPGETLEETALREVREETGLEVEITSSLGSIEYWFSDYEADVRYHKTVHFYLMVTVGGDMGLHDPEFDVVQWFSLDEALTTISYPNEADILRRAFEAIGKSKGDG